MFQPLAALTVVLAFAYPALAAANETFSSATGAATSARAWNAALLDAIRAETTPPALAARNLAIFFRGMAAVEAATGGDHVACALAANEMAGALFPGRRAYFARLAAVPVAETATRQPQIGAAMGVVNDLLASRAGDRATRSITFVPRVGEGEWQRTPPSFRPPELPHWAEVTPFVPAAAAEFERLRGPPDLLSQAFAAACAELRAVGGRQSERRTADQTTAAIFWSDFSYTATPVGHWNEIAVDLAAAQGWSERVTVKLLSVLNTALADGAIACWASKYQHRFWRPITVLPTQPEGAWEPFLNTPPHPEYPSGHSVFTGAAVAVLRTVLGGDEVEFSARSDRLPGTARMFRRLSDAALEISQSRIWGGIHFRFSCEDGLALGEAVARQVLVAMADDVRAIVPGRAALP